MSVVGSGLGVSHPLDSSKHSNDRAVDSLFYESYDGASNQSPRGGGVNNQTQKISDTSRRSIGAKTLAKIKDVAVTID